MWAASTIVLSPLLYPSAEAAPKQASHLNYDLKNFTGKGKGKSAKEALSQARQNALLQAINTYLHTPQEKQSFKKLKPLFVKNTSRYLTRLKIITKVSLPKGGRYYTVLYQVKIKTLKIALVQAQVLPDMHTLSEQHQRPKIIVYYQNPFDESVYAKWSISRAHQYLIQHKFKVADQQVIQNLKQDEQFLAQNPKASLPQVLALRSEADLYLSIQIHPEIKGRSGEFTYIKTPVQISAFESSSAHPFIVKTYQPLNAQGKPKALAVRGDLDLTKKVVIEEAVASVMPQITQDILSHWKDTLRNGKAYFLYFENLTPTQATQIEHTLNTLVPVYEKQGLGTYLVRHRASLESLTDRLEETLTSEMGFSLDSFTLGKAYFKQRSSP